MAKPNTILDIYKNNTFKQSMYVGLVDGLKTDNIEKGIRTGTVRGVTYHPTPSRLPLNNTSLVMNYDDPNQINSLADVIFAKNKLQATGELFKNTFAPILNKDKYGRWDPKFGLAALNTLINVGETFDIVANPIKGLFMDGAEGFKKAINLDGKGRYNYDWDTGFWALDLALEMVSDPLNFVSFGLAGAAKSAGKSTITASVKSITTEAVSKGLTKMGKELTEEAVEEFVDTALKKTIKYTNSEFVRAGKKLPDYTKAFRDNLTKYITNTVGLEGEGLDTFLDVLKGVDTPKSLSSALDEKSLTILKSLKNAYTVVDKADKFVLKTGLSAAGVYPTYLIAKKVSPDWGNVAKRIVDKAINTVAQSPIAYKVKDAYSVVTAMADGIDKYTNATELLEALGSGKITHKELGDALTSRVTEHISKIKNAIEAHQKTYQEAIKLSAESGEPLEFTIKTHSEILNEIIYKETGFKTVEEYLENMLTLKGHVSVSSEYKLYEFEQFVKYIHDLDKKAEINKQLEVLKATRDKLTKVLDNSPRQALADTTEQTTYLIRDIEASTKTVYDLKNKVTVDYNSVLTDLDNIAQNAPKLIEQCSTVEELQRIKAALDDYFNVFDKDLTETLYDFNLPKLDLELDGVSSNAYIIKPPADYNNTNAGDIYARMDKALKDLRALENAEHINEATKLLEKNIAEHYYFLKERVIKVLNTTKDADELIKLYTDFKHFLNKIYDYVPDLGSFEKLWKGLDANVEFNLKNFFDEVFFENVDAVQKNLNGALTEATQHLNVNQGVDLLSDFTPKEIKAHLLEVFKTLTSNYYKVITISELSTYLKSLKAGLQTLVDLQTQYIPELAQHFEELLNTVFKQLDDIYAELRTLDGIESSKVLNMLKERLDISEDLIPKDYAKIVNDLIEQNKANIDELEPLAKTVEQACQEATHFMQDANKVAETVLDVIENINKNSEDVVEVVEKKISTLQNTDEFKAQTNEVLKILDSDVVKHLDISEGKVLENQYIEDALIEKIHNAAKILDDLSNGKQVDVKDVLRAQTALTELSTKLQTTGTIPADDLQTLLDYINMLRPEEIHGLKVKITADAIYYHLKGEQVANIMAYVSNERFINMINQMCSETEELGKFLSTVTTLDSEYAESVQKIISLAHNFRAYLDTHTKIMQLAANNVLTNEEVIALRSTLEKFARKRMGEVYQDFDKTVDEIIKETEKYYNYAYMYDKSLSQDKIIARKAKLYEEKYNISGYYHKADTDAKTTWAVFFEEIEKAKDPKYANKKFIALDIETQNLSDTTEILELGRYDGTKTKLYNRRFKTRTQAKKAIPSDSVLKKCYSDKATYDERVEAFLENHAPTQDVPALTARQYYENFLNELFADGDNVVLLMHNGIEFDMPRILYNMRKANVNSELIHKFKNLEVIDTLVEYRKQLGYIELELNKKEAIANILEQHFDSLQITDSTHFFDAGIRPLKDEVSNILKDYNPNKLNKLTQEELEELGEKAPKSVKEHINQGASATEEQLMLYMQDLRDALSEAGRDTASAAYKQVGLPFISKATLANLTPDMVDVEFRAFIESLGSDIMLTRMMYATPTMINPFGYKKAIDMPLVNDWFEIVADDVGYADARLMQLYTKISKQLENASEKFKYISSLEDEAFCKTMKDFIIDAKDILEQNQSLFAVWTKGLRVDLANPVADFVIARKLYSKVKNSLSAEQLLKYGDFIDVVKSTNSNVPFYKTPILTDNYDSAINGIKNATDLDNAFTEYELKVGANKIYSAKRQYTSSALRRTYNYIKKVQEYLKEYNKDGLKAYKKLTSEAMNNLCLEQTQAILKRTPDELLKYMVYNKAPIMFFATDEPMLKSIVTTLLEKESDYKVLGISFYKTDEEFFIYFNKDMKLDYFVDDLGFHATLNGNQIDIKYDSEFGLDFSKFRYGKDLDAIYKEMAEITNGQSIGQLGNQLTKDNIYNYFDQLPIKVQEALNLDELTKSSMFLGYTFDSMNIGSLASRQRYNQYMPSDITKLVANANPEIIKKANNKNLMLDYWFNKDMSVSALAEQFGEKELREYLMRSEDYIAVMLVEDPKYVGKGFHDKGYRVIKLDFGNTKLWEQAVSESNGAILVPSYMYSDIYDALNTSLLYDNPVYKVAHQLTYMTKLGQISTVGKLFRDVIESQLKIMIETKDVLGTLRNNYNSVKNLKAYKTAVCNILSLSEIDYDKLIAKNIDPTEFAIKYIDNRFEAEKLVLDYYGSLKDIMKMDTAQIFLDSNKKLYFEQINKSSLDEDTFNTLHTILSESGTLGQLPAWGKYTHELHKVKQAKFAQDYADGLIGPKMLEADKSVWQKTYDTVSNFGNILMTPVQYMDQVNRVSQYLTYMDSGFVNPISAIGRIARTHFDASIKSDAERLIELAIPFYAFFKHNAMYWAKAVTEQPWLARLFSDYLEEINDESQLGTVSDFEKLNNLSLQNHMLAGNIVLGKSNVTLKLNLPFMEAYQLATQPIGYFAGATSPVLQLVTQSWLGNNPAIPTGVTELLDIYRPYNFYEGGRGNLQWGAIVPFIGPTLQRWGPAGYAQEQYKDTGFLGNLIVPSVFGRLKRYNTSSAYKRRPNYMSEKQYKFLNKYGPNPQFNTNKKTYKRKTNNPHYYNKSNYTSRYYNNNYYKSKPLRTRYAKMTRYYPERLKRRPRTSAYKLLYNSYGKSRIQYLGLPRAVRSTPYAIRNYFNYTR